MGGDPARNNFNNDQTTQRLPAGGQLPSVLSGGEDPVQSYEQNGVVPNKKEANKLEFEKFLDSNTFVI